MRWVVLGICLAMSAMALAGGPASRPTTGQGVGDRLVEAMKKQSAAMDELSPDHRLRDGEVLRLFKAPFSQARDEVLRQQLNIAETMIGGGHGLVGKQVPLAIFGWRDGRMFLADWDLKDANLRTMLVGMGCEWPDIADEDLESYRKVSWPAVTGDLVYRADATIPQKIAALADLISRETGQHVQVLRQDVLMPCVVLHGKMDSPGYALSPPWGNDHAVFITGMPLNDNLLAVWAARLLKWGPGMRPKGTFEFSLSGMSYHMDAVFISGVHGESAPFPVPEMYLVGDDVCNCSPLNPPSDALRQAVAENLKKQVGGDWVVDLRSRVQYKLLGVGQ